MLAVKLNECLSINPRLSPERQIAGVLGRYLNQTQRWDEVAQAMDISVWQLKRSINRATAPTYRTLYTVMRHLGIQPTFTNTEPPAADSSISDTQRLNFVIERHTTWYPNADGKGMGKLCYDNPAGFLGPRQEASGSTMRQALDRAIVQYRAATGQNNYADNSSAKKEEKVETPISANADWLFRVIREQLGLEDDQPIHLEQTIIDLGGDSLDMVEVVMGAEEVFGIEIPDNMLGDEENLTVKRLLEIVDELHPTVKR